TPTTPQADQLQPLLESMRRKDAEVLLIEASSLALEQHRVDAMFWDVAVFSNLSQDHLDDHGSMAAYGRAKLKLFEANPRHVVLNGQDHMAADILKLHPSALRYGLDDESLDLYATEVVQRLDGIDFALCHGSQRVAAHLPFIGRYNVANVLAAVGIGLAMGMPFRTMADSLTSLRQPPGRMERVALTSGAVGIVDYAHSPESLQMTIQSIRECGVGRIVTVFGCGGDRDPTKRPVMGEISTRFSDLTIVTTDNPRSEDAERIIEEIAVGCAATDGQFETVLDRSVAIQRALDHVEPGDVLLLAGKGSEAYQLVGDERRPWSDVKVLQELDT
ncbi:MAG: Mur ligase family protein, partial [Nocardioides sp.]